MRSTPVTLIARKNLALWTALITARQRDELKLSSRAQAVADYLSQHGASFFDDIVAGLDLPRTFVEEALGELVAVGLTNSDGFSGLRALLLPSDRRKPLSGGAAPAYRAARRRRCRTLDADPARGDRTDRALRLPRESVEQIARTVLRRYGVVFWRLLAREAEWLPPWREMLMAYRRLEARGEIRGGRFVAGFSGEQFALPGGDRCAAHHAQRGQVRPDRRGERSRSAQSCRHSAAGAEGARALFESSRIPRRNRRSLR